MILLRRAKTAYNKGKNHVMNILGPSRHYLTCRYQLMSGHQLIKLLRLTGLAVMSPISSVSSDQIPDTRVISVTRQANCFQSNHSYGYRFS